MRTIISIVLLFTLGACSLILPPEVIGPYAASLSREDISEIRALAAQNAKIATPVNYIHALSPTFVRAEADDADFDVRKRNGHWYIEGIQQLRTIEGS